MELLILAALLGLIPAAIARSKGRSFGLWWFYGAMILIVALPHALIMRPNREMIDAEREREGLRRCPFCAEFIRPEAIVCKHCGRDLPPPALPPTQAPRAKALWEDR
ncbi:zinc ribbon domain-containing protein [Hansschlegelia zhihuaiae]|uniref:Zinc ribbon domain-containing protein n=1 Tax=Hansschlegelia zhihuaiae TaxID=405005 RepID=A0A4Q0MGH0_9HYPH|nr:zinc ribbon domain-containing protein [Hansschlegelia zhihuaiae]RXF72089.1 zinc ribbon domain-containing protein [Hansschlegelia zhihuaiae]